MCLNIILFLFVCSLLGPCLGQGGGGGGAGGQTYAVIFESAIYVCLDPVSLASMNTSDLEVVSHNETASTIAGSMWIMKDMPESNVRVLVIVKKEVGGNFEVILTLDICDICKELHEDSDYQKYLKHFLLPKACPFTEGIYIVEGFVPKEDDLPRDSNSAGRYQVTIFVSYNPAGEEDCDKHEGEEMLTCMKLDFGVDAV